MVRDKKSRNSAWQDTQKRPVVKQVRRASKRKDVCTGTPSLEVMSVVLPRTSRGHGSCIGLSNVSVVFFHRENEAELLVCLMKSLQHDETTWKLESCTWNAGCECTLAKTGSTCVAIHCSGQTGCGVWYDVIETSGTILDWSSSDWDQSPISRQPTTV